MKARDRSRHPWLRAIHSWLLPWVNPRRVWGAIPGYVRYFRDWQRYRRLPGAEPLRWRDSMPQLFDLTSSTPFDSHYFYINGWAMRHVVRLGPKFHVDIGSDIMFANLLSAVVPLTFVDYRPLLAKAPGMTAVAGDALALPFASGSIPSLSCLHVAEHVGLGRYGDPLDSQGTKKIAQELQRVLARGGSLFFAVPVGRQRTCFNAHRIHAPEAIRSYFPDLRLVEFAGVHDDGTFAPAAEGAEFARETYGCGMFRFTKD